MIVALLLACQRPPDALPVAAAPTPPPGEPILTWGARPYTVADADAVRACDLENAAAARYAMPIDPVTSAFAPVTACEQAVLAEACAARADGVTPMSPVCIAAYRAAVAAIPAYAFQAAIPGAYFAMMPLAAPPPQAALAIRRLDVHYTWGGLGDSVDWELVVDDADTVAKLAVKGAHERPVPDLGARVQAVRGALGDFVPVPGPIHAVDCYDNYPDWTMDLTFADGQTLSFATYGSNLIGLGGPWQATVDGKSSLQLAPGLAAVVGQLVMDLGLPIGEPAGMYCPGFDLGAAVLAFPAE
jgi:hypothetical protein